MPVVQNLRPIPSLCRQGNAVQHTPRRLASISTLTAPFLFTRINLWSSNVQCTLQPRAQISAVQWQEPQRWLAHKLQVKIGSLPRAIPASISMNTWCWQTSIRLWLPMLPSTLNIAMAQSILKQSRFHQCRMCSLMSMLPLTPTYLLRLPRRYQPR